MRISLNALNPLHAIRWFVSTGRHTRIGRNLSAVMAATIVGNLLQFGWILMMTRLLGVERFGIWGSISAYLVIAAALPEFGMGMIILREVSGKPAERGRYLAAMLLLQPLLAVITALGLILLSGRLPYSPDWRALLAVASVTLLTDTLGNMAYSQFLAAEQMIPPSVIRILHQISVIVFGAAVLISGGSLFGLYLAVIAGSILRAVMFWIALRLHDMRVEFRPFAQIRRYQRLLLHDGFPLMLGALLTLGYRNVNTILVSAFASSQQVALLTTANVIVFGVIDLLSSTVLVALSPVMARTYTEDAAKFRRLINRFLLIIVGLGTCAGIGAWLFAGPVLNILPPAFRGTADILKILIWFGVLVMVSDVLSLVMVVRGRGARTLWYRSAAVVVTLMLNVVLLPALLAQGAALALTLAQAVLCLLMLLDYHNGGAIKQLKS